MIRINDQGPSNRGSVLRNMAEADQERLGEILDGYLEEVTSGGAPTLDQLCRQHPELETEIRFFVGGLRLLEQAAAEVPLGPQRPHFAIAGDTDQLGEFRLVRELGRGGMGVVYEALELASGQRVALKILPFSAVLDERRVLRFQHEARAAASLSHPHIVPVYALGNDRGTQYFSMRLIEGRSVEQLINELKHGAGEPEADGRIKNLRDGSTVRCDAVAPTARSVQSLNHVHTSVQLIAQAAEAIDYAHRQGVVHRDVKPSNLLVDAAGKLWVTDFGLAQCEGWSNHTRTGDLVGTLRYMSPEQAAGRTQWIDHRTDIYSLAATLYELLTLRPVVTGADRMAMLSQIAHQEAVPASRLNRAVPSELDHVLAKALCKERDDRYATAADFAADLHCILARRKPFARKLSLLDRGSRWIARRARLVAIGTVAAGLVLMFGIGGLAYMKHQNQLITDANQRARQHLQLANESVFRFGSQLLPRLELLPGTDALRQEIAGQTLRYFQDFVVYADGDPSLRYDVAQAWMTVASIESQLGQFERSLLHYRQASERLTELSEEGDGKLTDISPPRLFQDLMLCRNNEACVLAESGQFTQSRRQFEDALEALSQYEADHDDQSRVLRSSFRALLSLNVGIVCLESDHVDDARRFLDLAITSLRDVQTADSPSRLDMPELTPLLISSLLQAGQMPGVERTIAIALLREALRQATDRRARATEPTSAAHDLALCQLALGSAIHEAGGSEEAEKLLERADAELLELSRQHPAVIRFQLDRAGALNNLGHTQMALRSLESARKSFESARQLLEETASRSNDYLATSDLGGVLHNLASVAVDSGNHELAADLLNQAIEAQEHALELAPESSRCRDFLASHRKFMAQVVEKLGLREIDQ